MSEHKRDWWGYVEMDCDCEECYYYRLSYKFDRFSVADWGIFDRPGLAVVEHEEDISATREALHDEAVLMAAGEGTWKGGGTLRLNRIKIGHSYPMYGEPGEVFLRLD